MNDMKWFLRPVCSADAVTLHRNCFPEQSLVEVESHLRWCLRQMDKGRMVRLVAELDAQAVANGQLALYRSRGEIGSLVVAPLCRRRGIGTALLRALVAEAQRLQVCRLDIAVRSDLQWVSAWYRRLGFEPCEERTLPGNEHVAVLSMSVVSGEHLLPAEGRA